MSGLARLPSKRLTLLNHWTPWSLCRYYSCGEGTKAAQSAAGGVPVPAASGRLVSAFDGSSGGSDGSPTTTGTTGFEHSITSAPSNAFQRTIGDVLDTPKGKLVVAFHNRMYGRKNAPEVPYADVVRFIKDELRLPVRQVISAVLTEEKYNKPSPNSTRPGDTRRSFTGQLTANMLKALQGGCACGACGQSFAGYTAENMGRVPLHHIDPQAKRKKSSYLFHRKLEGDILKEVRGLRALTANCHNKQMASAERARQASTCSE